MASSPGVKGSQSPSFQQGTPNKNKLSPCLQASKLNIGKQQSMLFSALATKSESHSQDTFTKTGERGPQEPERAKSPENTTQSQRAALYWEAFKGHPEALAQRVMKRYRPEIEQWKQNQELEALETWMEDFYPEELEAGQQQRAAIGLVAWMEQSKPERLVEWQKNQHEDMMDGEREYSERQFGPWLQANHEDVLAQWEYEESEIFDQWVQKEHFDIVSQWGTGYSEELQQQEEQALENLWAYGGKQQIFTDWLNEKHPNALAQWDEKIGQWVTEERNAKILRPWVKEACQNLEDQSLPESPMQGPDQWLQIDDSEKSDLIALDQGFTQQERRCQFETMPLKDRNFALACFSNDDRHGGQWPLAATILGAGGIDVNESDRKDERILEITGTTPLMRVATDGNLLQMMQGLLSEGADVNQKDSLLGETALFYAILAGKDKAVDFLINNKANVNCPNILGTTPLMTAAGLGREKIVRALLKAGADVNAKSQSIFPPDTDLTFNAKYGETALMRAAELGHKRIVEALLDAGADVNAKTKNDETALMRAVKSGNQDTVDMLIAAGADVNAKTKSGETALMRATGLGRKEIVQRLIATGADINAKMENGETALRRAAQSGDKEMVRILRAAGGTTSYWNNWKQSIKAIPERARMKRHRAIMNKAEAQQKAIRDHQAAEQDAPKPQSENPPAEPRNRYSCVKQMFGCFRIDLSEVIGKLRKAQRWSNSDDTHSVSE